MSEKQSKLEAEAELKVTILKAHRLVEHHKDSEAEFKAEKEKAGQAIGNLMRKLGITEFEFTPRIGDKLASKNLSCKYVQSKSITYLQSKIEEKFDKEFCNEVINKQYSVNDMRGLIEMLKDYRVSPKEFKKFIIIQKTVNVARIEQLYELGEITMKDLDGCYEVSEQKGSWKVAAKKQ